MLAMISAICWKAFWSLLSVASTIGGRSLRRASAVAALAWRIHDESGTVSYTKPCCRSPLGRRSGAYQELQLDQYTLVLPF
jgi:hypothetical protein